jgi:hypothetical protein
MYSGAHGNITVRANSFGNEVLMPSSYTIKPQPTQKTLLKTFQGVRGGKCYNTVPILPTVCSMFSLYTTIKQQNRDSKGVWFAGLLPVAPVNIPASDGNIHKYIPCPFKGIYSISRVDTSFGQKKKIISYHDS